MDEKREQQERENAERKTALQQSSGNKSAEANSNRKLEFTNEPDKRSPEERSKAIEEHEENATNIRQEHTERAMQVPDHIRDYKGPFNGGHDIIDTRGRPTSFQAVNIPVATDSPHERAKRQIAEEAGTRRNQPSDAEQLAFEQRPHDPTARAEVIARG